MTLLPLLALGFTFFVSLMGAKLDIQEACEAAQQPFDRAYLSQHRQDTGQLFPRHDLCNADYDLVPGWINPALVIFAVVTVACLIGAAAATVRLIRNSR
ncbi:hypothetical protein [Amycolatopsis panacis]|uniref:Uncharacterized protein n=1 Tax=Amycolatopsis panacis TaxID=2340917 RepID=A0A419IBW7_9PSEU|nr:hypothetical protein [Amycolatopsis panacis]RJQ92531.1 hypothetical protein D5S19_00350 [Amycolatopsis panacis]